MIVRYSTHALVPSTAHERYADDSVPSSAMMWWSPSCYYSGAGDPGKHCALQEIHATLQSQSHGAFRAQSSLGYRIWHDGTHISLTGPSDGALNCALVPMLLGTGIG